MSQKVYTHLNLKFGIQVVDRSYEKIKITTVKCEKIWDQIGVLRDQTDNLLEKWKRSIDRIDNLATMYAGSANIMHKEVANNLRNCHDGMENLHINTTQKMMTTTLDEAHQASKRCIGETEVISGVKLVSHFKAQQL